MASFHHHHHPSHHHPVPAAPTTTTCCCCPSTCRSSIHPSPPPPQHSSIDPLLHSLASLLQHHQNQQTPSFHSPHSNTKPNAHKNHHQISHFQSPRINFQYLFEEQDYPDILSSLLQRISTLEASLHHFSASNKRFQGSFSLREAAAKVIQTHFRAFLVRRSRTLSQLQELAFIKSTFNALKSSALNKTHFNYALVSHKVTDLLLKLDSVQSRDPMIRDGKRSISRVIVRFLDFIDELGGRRRESLYKPVKNVRIFRNRALNSNNGNDDLSRNQKEIVEKLKERVEKIRGIYRACENVDEDVELEGFQQFIDDDEDGDGDNDDDKESVKVSNVKNGILVKRSSGKPRVKKFVSFDEDGNVCRVFSDTHESVLNGDGDFSDRSDSSDDREVRNGTQNDEVIREENHASTRSNDSESSPVSNFRGFEYYKINGNYQDQEGKIVFSAPTPVKMEVRADLMKNRKAAKIGT
ncbi:BAG family molecular chaperone regulator 8, chloroplastic [Mercurialis annua]|uniref:BAG family molecular chaperone regulator 8, chloroplastic n=1 Tax=Mercurialis annua TaxID=3986 RepID=UPI00215FF190|nr:BAG family molecular chaperone regulator 8, chloroplastic [Mercurialis annua]